MDWGKSSLAQQCYGAEKRRRKVAAADLVDPRAFGERSGVQDRLAAVVESHISRGKVSGLVLACGSSVFVAEQRRKRLLNCDKKKQEWMEKQRNFSLDSDSDIDSEPTSDDEDLEDSVFSTFNECKSASNKLSKDPIKSCPATPQELYQQYVVVDQQEADRLEMETREQWKYGLWHAEKRFRVTATLCKAVVCRKKTDFSGLVNRKLHESFRGNTATHYGTRHEQDAIDEYIASKIGEGLSISVATSGLVISASEPWLACSPGAIISDSSASCQSLLEVKCPHHCRDKLLLDAAENLTFCLQRDPDGTLKLRKRHSYYYQVQHGMMVTGLKWCDFVVWTPAELFVQ